MALGYISSASYKERIVGIRALYFFKSEENINRVKAMLEDPGFSDRYDRSPDMNSGSETKYYGVRSAAYSVLRCWGLDIRKPVISEKSPK